MKKAKIALSFFLFLLCFVFSAELYQNHITNFSNDVYHFQVGTSLDDTGHICDILSDLADEQDIGMFVVASQTTSSYSYECTVYTNEKAKDTLKSNYNISAGTFKSLFSGETEVEIRDFSDVATDLYGQDINFYFISDYDTVDNIRMDFASKDFSSEISPSAVHKGDSSGIERYVILIWLAAFLLLMVLTWFDIQFQKKENFVLMSLGVSKQSLIIKNIAVDAGAFAVVFLLLYIVLGNFIYVNYAIKTIALAFLLFVIINGALYLSLLRVDMKQILYGANINSNILSNCYLLKALAMILAVLSLSVNVSLIAYNAGYLTLYDNIDYYDSYSFLNVVADTSGIEDDDEAELIQNKTMTSIFLDYYKEGKVALSLSDAEDEYSEYIMLNENAMQLVSTEIPIADTEKNFTIYIPERNENEDTADFALRSTLYAVLGLDDCDDDITYDVVVYSEDADIIYFDNSGASNGLEFGFGKEESPVFIYCNLSEDLIESKANLDEGFASYTFGDVMFLISEDEAEQLAEKYNLTSVSYISVTDQVNQYKTTFLRILLMNTAISVFMIMLEVIIIVTIIKMEYMVNAKQIAIKKILGYSTFSNNKMVFLLNIFSAAIGIITITIASLMYNFVEWYIALLVGVVLVALECFIILYNIQKFERANITKILKGGSL